MECKQCGVEYDGRADSKTCSTKCRVGLKRYIDKQADVSVTRTRTTGCKCAIPGDEDYVGCVVDGQIAKPDPIPVKDLTRFELGQAIRAYPHDQWINSPEHKELMDRLHYLSPEQLEAEGFHVPAWKVAS